MTKPRHKSSARTVLLDWDGRHLRPVTQFDAETLDALPRGDVEFEIYPTRRSLPHQRLYWAMLRSLAAQCDGLTSEALHHQVKLDTGHVKLLRLPSGMTVAVADSTSFANMDQTEWRAFFDKAVEVLARMFGIDPLSLYREGKAKITTSPQARAA